MQRNIGQLKLYGARLDKGALRSNARHQGLEHGLVQLSGVCWACQVHVTLKAHPTATLEVCQDKVQLHHHPSASLQRNMLRS
jgi:hypothetical protein